MRGSAAAGGRQERSPEGGKRDRRRAAREIAGGRQERSPEGGKRDRLRAAREIAGGRQERAPVACANGLRSACGGGDLPRRGPGIRPRARPRRAFPARLERAVGGGGIRGTPLAQ